jgi:hypothetical protein
MIQRSTPHFNLTLRLSACIDWVRMTSFAHRTHLFFTIISLDTRYRNAPVGTAASIEVWKFPLLPSYTLSVLYKLV